MSSIVERVLGLVLEVLLSVEEAGTLAAVVVVVVVDELTVVDVLEGLLNEPLRYPAPLGKSLGKNPSKSSRVVCIFGLLVEVR